MTWSFAHIGARRRQPRAGTTHCRCSRRRAAPLGPAETARPELPQPPDTLGWHTNASPQSSRRCRGAAT